MPTEQKIKNFTNEMAMSLIPSNDTMEAVRWVREHLPDFIRQIEIENATELCESLSKATGMEIKYTPNK